MSQLFSKTVVGEEAMVELGAAIGSSLLTTSNEDRTNSALVFFEGDLGAGKTTLCRGILQTFGHRGAVKSPTYTLVESYDLNTGDLNPGELYADKLSTIQVHHFDLYRLGDPEELEFIGIRDYLQPGNYCLIEWPNRGEGILPTPDLNISIDVAVNKRSEKVNDQREKTDEQDVKTIGRTINIESETEKGKYFLAELIKNQGN
jgi:tRNA threonylcarbamoyladenosine biosynthesis protein TsaE